MYRPKLAALAKRLFPYWVTAWCAGLLVVAATLGASHLYAQPRPATSDSVVSSSMAALRGDDLGVIEIHVLYSECRCSQKLIEYLLDRGSLATNRERILLVGDAPESARRLTEKGFMVRQITQEQLVETYHLSSAPLLLVLGGDDQLRYMGGHTGHKQGLDYQDVAITRAIEADQKVRELPSFGCAVSRELQRRLDPLALKYGVK